MPFPKSVLYKSVNCYTSSLHNHFSGLHGEPGHGQYYYFSGSEMNTVLGHDNFANEPHSEDPKFVHLNAESLHASVELSSDCHGFEVCFGTKRDMCGAESSGGSLGLPSASSGGVEHSWRRYFSDLRGEVSGCVDGALATGDEERGQLE